ncbi:MarR family transcriptional regulator [Pseudooctadecabacter sp.]|uniref:MarR family transcriptional regulator n=1 Tax=Pseudooctadecabacter sp. TaxID=1966338 RepID=UPI0035C81D04
MQTRIFEILEYVAKFGPITLDQLTERTGFSRSATFRGLKRLEEGGWVRLRLNGRQYVLTCRVEQKLNTKVEPKEEIERLTPIIDQCIDLKSIRVRIFQQETTATIELVDDSEYKSFERLDHSMAFECGEFLLSTLQYAGLAVGKSKLSDAELPKACKLLEKMKKCNFVIVSEQRFLWLPLFSGESDVFLICLSRRDFS